MKKGISRLDDVIDFDVFTSREKLTKHEIQRKLIKERILLALRTVIRFRG